MLVFKPPFIYSNLNAIFAIISSTILATIFISRKNKIKNLIITSVLILFFIYQLIFYKISASFAIIVSTLALLYMSAKTNHIEKQAVSKNFKNAIYWISVTSVLFSFPFLFESHLNRYSTLNGDPNYTALVTITPLLLALTITHHSLKKSICILLIIFILITSASRTALLAVIIFFINYRITTSLYSKIFVIIILLISIFSQYIALIIPELLTSLSSSEDSIRLFNMNDRSNEIRLESYNLALTTIQDNFNYFLINGTRDYRSWAPGILDIPHNWFIQSVLGYGFLLTLIVTITMARSILKLVSSLPQIIPFLSFLLFYAGILSIYPLQVPLTLVIFYFLSTKYRPY